MYYRLTCASCTDKSKDHDSLLNSLKPIEIGQTPSCALHLPTSVEHEPEIFATIQPLENGVWCIVRRTDYCDIKVNGNDLKVAQPLRNKDEILLADTENATRLRFEVFSDGDYDAASGIVYAQRKAAHTLLAACLAFAIVAIGIACFAIFGNKSKDLRHSISPEYAKALYHITVDSVSLLEMTTSNSITSQRVIESVELQQAAVGTAFVTTDGLLVTARHCLEPWLDDTSWDGRRLDSKMQPEVRLAVMAETRNQILGERKYIIRSHCIISQGGYARGFYSTDFKMDKSRDMIMELGTDDNPLYCRTIFPIAHRRDMELGDFAYMTVPADFPVKTKLPVAKMKDIETFGSPKGDHDIAVMGYPVNDNDADDNVKTDFGNAQPLEFTDNHEFAGCMQMTAPINRGNSGGPVLALIDGRVIVVGIVSKADHKADQQTFWSVPITEVSAMHNRGDRPKEDITTFRR